MKAIKYYDLNTRELESVWEKHICPYCGNELEIIELKITKKKDIIYMKEAYCEKCGIIFKFRGR